MHSIRPVVRHLLHAEDGQQLTFFVEATILVGAVITIAVAIVPAPVMAIVHGGHGTKHAGAGAYLLVGIGRAVMRPNGVNWLLEQAI